MYNRNYTNKSLSKGSENHPVFFHQVKCNYYNLFLVFSYIRVLFGQGQYINLYSKYLPCFFPVLF